MWRRAIGVAVLERVAGAIDAGALAVPEPEHAIDLAVGLRLALLRPEHRSCREFLVHGGEEFDVVALQSLLDAPQLEIDAAERRAAIAGDEAGGVEPRGAVAPELVERDADDGLRTREEDPAVLALVAVGEFVGVE